MTSIFETRPPSSSESRRSLQLQRATRILAARQARRKFFSPAMFGEPAWELLLVLYLADEQCTRLTITSLCHNSGFPSTTALRWLHFLEGKQLVSRVPSPVDKRIHYVDLTDTARLALDRYLLEAPLV
jgi:DNA-binding MarR family transcriptional regulator